MSSSQNASSSSKSEEFNLKDIEVLVDSEEQSWFKRDHAGTFLEISHIDTSTAKLGQDDNQKRASLQAGPTPHSMGVGPDININLFK